MIKMIIKIFSNVAAGSPAGSLPEAYAQQVRFFRRVWHEETYGLERLVRLGLCAAQFFFPVLLIRDIFGRWGATGRKLAVEAYAVFKFFFPLMVLWQGWYRSPVIIFLIIYFLSDTFVHILHLIFLSDIHEAAVSYRRSLLLIFLHYAETAFDFATLYMAFDLLNKPMDAVSALYFSIVATTTVGFGDITAKNTAGQMVVMTQLSICVVFIIVFINYFSQKQREK
jgi:hypothetical protein